MDELAIGQMRPDPKAVTSVDITERQNWRQIQRSVQDARQRKLRLPVDVRLVGLGEDPRSFDRRVDGILNHERLRRINLVLDQREGVIEAVSSDANRRGETRIRLSGIALERYRVVDPLRIGEEPI